MLDWWNALPFTQQLFFMLALPSTAILLIQTVLLMFGGGGDSELDSDVSGLDHGGMGHPDLGHGDLDHGGLDYDGHDTPGHESGFDADGLRIFTVRGILAFFAVSGWSGVFLVETKAATPVLVLVPLVLGILALIGMAWLTRTIMGLQEISHVDYRRALGGTAEVYLVIPAEAAGAGKIAFSLQGQWGEFPAVTHGPERIQTGSLVRIVDIADGDIFIVEKE